MKTQNYPLYTPPTPTNMKEMLTQSAKTHGSKPAFHYQQGDKEITITYTQLKTDTEALSAALSHLGLKSAKAALIGENSYHWVLSYFAVVNSGNIIVPLDKELPPADIKSLIDHSEAETLIFSDTYADIAAYLKENNANIKHYINMNQLPELIAQNHPPQDQAIDSHAMAALMYTSGTTGSPKGVMLSHSNIVNDGIAICQYVQYPPTSLLVLPLHHIAGFVVALICPIINGSSIAINLSMKNLASDFGKYKPGFAVFVPLLVDAFHKQIKAAAAKMGTGDIAAIASKVFGGNLTTMISGAAPLDGKYVEAYQNMGITLINGYGLTESAAAISCNRNGYNRPGSVGLIVPCCQVKIASPGPDGHGEILAKGKNIMLGYYKNEEATNAAFEGDWLKTGDIGYVDPDGFLYISGRAKNLILLSNGKNVYPEEVEFAICKQIPYVKEAVVYAAGDEIIAELYLDTENNPDCTTRLERDIEALNRTLPPYKNINKTITRDTEFPKTSSKKIKRTYQ